jgi:hypothetical protein
MSQLNELVENSGGATEVRSQMEARVRSRSSYWGRKESVATKGKTAIDILCDEDWEPSLLTRPDSPILPIDTYSAIICCRSVAELVVWINKNTENGSNYNVKSAIKTHIAQFEAGVLALTTGRMPVGYSVSRGGATKIHKSEPQLFPVIYNGSKSSLRIHTPDRSHKPGRYGSQYLYEKDIEAGYVDSEGKHVRNAPQYFEITDSSALVKHRDDLLAMAHRAYLCLSLVEIRLSNANAEKELRKAQEARECWLDPEKIQEYVSKQLEWKDRDVEQAQGRFEQTQQRLLNFGLMLNGIELDDGTYTVNIAEVEL